MENIKDGEKVLLIWSGVTPPQDLQQIVSRMSQLVGSSGKVNVEHIDRLKLCKLPGEFAAIFYLPTLMKSFIMLGLILCK